MAQIESAVDRKVISFGSHEARQREGMNINLWNNRTFNVNKRDNYRNDGAIYRSSRALRRKASTMLGEVVGEACIKCRQKDHKPSY